MKVLVYPRDWNPYQDLLYRRLRNDHGVKVTYIRRYPRLEPVSFVLWLLFRRAQGYRLLHLHWPAFGIGLDVPNAAKLSRYGHLLCIWLLKILRYRVVWTVHNVVPHEPETDDDVGLARRLAAGCDRKIVHSQATLDQMRELGLDTARCRVIPHGNYIGVYERTLSRSQARSSFGFGETETVLLFFGNMRGYKGIEDLLDAFEHLGDGSRLLLAGDCSDPQLRELLTRATNTGRVTLSPGRVADAEVARYFDACDVVCLPFKTVTTSGSAILAASFGKPIIAPRIGALADFPAEVGFFYDGGDPTGLPAAITDAAAHAAALPELGRNAMAYALTLDWAVIATRTMSVYEELS